MPVRGPGTRAAGTSPRRGADRGVRASFFWHLFRFTPETIKAASDLLRFLLRRHYRRLRLPRTLEHRLIRELRKDPVFEQWPLAQIVPNREAFFAFLQERWPVFLDRQTSGSVAVHESTERYGLAFRGPAELPFDHPDVRVYIDNLFLEGALPADSASGRAGNAGFVGTGRYRDRPAGGIASAGSTGC